MPGCSTCSLNLRPLSRTIIEGPTTARPLFLLSQGGGIPLKQRSSELAKFVSRVYFREWFIGNRQSQKLAKRRPSLRHVIDEQPFWRNRVFNVLIVPLIARDDVLTIPNI